MNVEANMSERRVIDCLTKELTLNLESGSTLDLLVMCHKYNGEQRLDAVLAADSVLNITILDLDNDVMDRHMSIDLLHPGAHCSIRSVALCDGTQSNSNYVQMKHMVENCTSDQTFRSVASGSAKVLFNGLIYVARGANGTQALQQSRNILLSDTAHVDTQPQLEIYADDVKCNHGAATGSFDTEALYYMRQRGISLVGARALLLEGFCKEVVGEQWFDLMPQLSERLSRRLKKL